MAVAPLSAQVVLLEDWSEYTVGTNVVTDTEAPWFRSYGSDGGDFTADVLDASGTRVLNTQPGKTASDTDDNILLVGREFAPASGQLRAEVDVKVMAGGARIFLSSGSGPFSTSLEVRFGLTSQGTLNAYDGTLNSAGARSIGTYSADEWYRVTIDMFVNSDSGSLSTYSVTVSELESGLEIGSVENLSFNGNPTSLSYITIGSALSASGNAEWGQLSVTQIPEPGIASVLVGLVAMGLCVWRRKMRN